MREKRQRERSKAPLPLLSYHAENILIAKNRNLSPLVLSFIYEPENIALKDLGTLFGTFIVTDHHEDSGYIVNCLAAAAKKEYFINSRRSVEESFESTLHKINLTLGKLVRDGHINWMGKLHGSIIAIHNREAYFSVTGEATILLLRDSILSAISDGLADPEAAAHPLKTFTDISEGTLLVNDKVILSTPELLELLPHALLEREAGKLPLDRFAQLVRTALINERSAAATILIDFFESTVEDTRGALRMTPKSDDDRDDAPITPLIENIFSSQPFHKEPKIHPATGDIATTIDTGEKERIDNRTGHIYIQADTTPSEVHTETATDRVIVILKERCIILFIKGKKYAHKYAIAIGEGISSALSQCFQWLMRSLWVLVKDISRLLSSAFACLFTYFRGFFSRSNSFTNISFYKTSVPTPEHSMPATSSIPPMGQISFPPTPDRTSLGAPLSRLVTRLIALTSASIRKLHGIMLAHWNHRSARQKWIIGSTLCLILIGVTLLILTPKPIETPSVEPAIVTPPPVEPVFPPANEPLAQAVSGVEVMTFSSDEAPSQILVLRDTIFILTDHSLINGETKASMPLPASVTPVRLASAMRDLNAIFLYGADKKMYIFYPNAKSAIENTFPLPNDFTLSDMGTYLTYLYAFDAKAGRILRFPRAEGGFGAPTEWLKETMLFDEHAKMSIGESILIGSKNSVFSFTKGRGGMLELSETKTPVNIQDISVSQDGSFTILDATEKRIVRFNKDGELLGQYFSKGLGDASRLTTLSNGSTAFVAIQDRILSFELR